MGHRNNAPSYSDLLARIYDASLDRALWPVALSEVCRAINAGGVSLFVQNRQRSIPPIFFTHNIPSEGASEYLQHYVQVDPRVEHFTRNPHLDLCWDYQHITERQMNRNEYYEWVLRTSGFRYYAGGRAVSLPGYEGWIAPQRTPRQGHYDRADLETFERLLSHIRRSVDIMLHIDQKSALNESLLDAMDQIESGILLLDARERILVANKAAQAMLGDRDGLYVVNSAVHASISAEDRALRRVFAETRSLLSGTAHAPGTPVRVSRPSGKRPYTFTVCPLSRSGGCEDVGRAKMLAFIVDPERARVAAEDIAELYVLTPAESRLTAALANGMSVKEYGHTTKLKPNTVRSTLKRVFEKTDTSRQSELVRKVLVGEKL